MKLFLFLFGLVVGSVVNQAQCQAQSIGIQPTPSSPSATIQPPVGLPSHVYTNPSSGTMTIQPPAGLPSHVYTNPSSGAMTVQPSVGLPTMVYPNYGGAYEGR